MTFNNEMSNFRKLPRDLECPVDNLILDSVDVVNPYFYKLRFTPNLLTTFSAIFGVSACYLCLREFYVCSSVLYFIGYFFDCADGNFARRYNMVSRFGDYFDHIKDILVSFSLLFVFLYKLGFTLLCLQVFTIGMVLTSLNNLYLGQQEAYFKGQRSEFLNKIVFKSNISLKILRFFGCGTLNCYISAVILLLGWH